MNDSRVAPINVPGGQRQRRFPAPRRGYMMAAALAVLVVLSLPVALPARADYAAGQQAWDAGHINEALTQWQASAANGDRRAMHALGRLYLRGLGVLQNYVEAHKWFNLAASRGDAGALAERDSLAEKMTPAQVAEAQALARIWRESEIEAPTVPVETIDGGTAPARVAAAPAPTAGATPAHTATASTETPGVLAVSETAPAHSASPDDGPEAALEPKCASMEEGAACWKEIEDKLGCYVWDDHYFPEQTVTWTGPCTGGVIVGEGTLVWTKDGDSVSSTGTAVDGKRQGHWVAREADGTVAEGPYVDGKRHGRWVRSEADGDVSEGPYVDGKKHGHWVWRLADGTVAEGPYADGKMHGHWVLQYADGGIAEGPYVDGEKRGHWVWRLADGTVAEGPYVDGKRHGRWVRREADGDVGEGPYVDGRKQGNWVERYADGDVGEGPYVDNKRHGHWMVRSAEGTVSEGPYVDGKRHGHWVIDHPMIVLEGPYVDDKMHGQWVQRTATGDALAGPYVDGKQHGRWLELITPFGEGAEASCGFTEYDQDEEVDSGDLAREECSALESAGTAPTASPREDEASLELEPAQREQIQIGLWALGFNPGPPDGIFGERTRHAIRLWQASRNDLASGYLNVTSARTLQNSAPDPSGPIWLTAQNQPCKVWNPHPEAGEVLTWSGHCVDGKASGMGRLVWHGSYGRDVFEGEYRHGKRNGHGRFARASGNRYEGHYVDDVPSGHGTFTWADGVRYEGEYADGKPHGYGVQTDADGNVRRGIWKHGCWGEKGGRWATIGTTAEACGFR